MYVVLWQSAWYLLDSHFYMFYLYRVYALDSFVWLYNSSFVSAHSYVVVNNNMKQIWHF